MVQVLPHVPGFGERLGQVLGDALGDAGKGYVEGMRKRADQGILSDFQNAKSPLEIVQRAGKLSPELLKNLSPAITALVRDSSKEKDQSGLSDQDYSNIINNLEAQLNNGGAGLQAYLKSFIPGDLGSKERQSTAQFESESTALLGLAQKIALKNGIRNQREFDAFLKRTIPNQSDTVETARGKLQALKSYLGGDFSQNSQLNQQQTSSLKEGAKLDSLPPASEYPNAVFKKGNKRYISNGKNWEVK